MSPAETRYQSQFPLRLPRSLREAAKQLALKEGISLNHFICLALAEKISRAEHQATSSPVNQMTNGEGDLPQMRRPGKLV